MLALPFLAVVLITCSLTAICQQKKQSEKIKVYHAFVDVTTQRKHMAGVIQQVSDSAIYLLTKDGQVRIASNVIKQIAIKRKGNVGRGVLTGSIIGIGVGTIIGFASGDDECDGTSFCFAVSAEEKAVASAVVLGGLGALIGWGMGSMAIKHIKIDENQYVFEKNAELLRTYSLDKSQ